MKIILFLMVFLCGYCVYVNIVDDDHKVNLSSIEVSLAEVVKNPDALNDQTIKTYGMVTEYFSLFGHSWAIFKDEEGNSVLLKAQKSLIISNNVICVTAVVRSIMKIRDLGLVVLEEI